MDLKTVIAVDGPAGSGKSTLGRRLATRLGYLYFDTGVMYRAVAYAALAAGVPVKDEAAVSAMMSSIHIDVRPPSIEDGRDCDVLLDGEDITWKIRTPEVNNSVSFVSAYAEVRKALTGQQRRIGLRGKVVMVGRDIGTVVLPDAGLKVYLDASLEVRAHRRYEESLARGEKISLVDTQASLQGRDQIDSTRAVAPLKPAEDAVYIDSDEMTIEDVVDKVMNLIEEAA